MVCCSKVNALIIIYVYILSRYLNLLFTNIRTSVQHIHLLPSVGRPSRLRISRDLPLESNGMWRRHGDGESCAEPGERQFGDGSLLVNGWLMRFMVHHGSVLAILHLTERAEKSTIS